MSDNREYVGRPIKTGPPRWAIITTGIFVAIGIATVGYIVGNFVTALMDASRGGF